MGNTLKIIKTTVVLGGVVQAVNTISSGSFAVSLANNCDDYSSLAAVFDQYKISHVEIIFKPRFNYAAYGSGGQPPVGGFIYTVLDYDDSKALTATSSATDYSTCIVTPLTEEVRRCYQPRMALAAWNSATFTGYVNSPAPWIDCNSANIPHFGVKYVVDTAIATTTQVWDVITRTEFLFRAAR